MVACSKQLGLPLVRPRAHILPSVLQPVNIDNYGGRLMLLPGASRSVPTAGSRAHTRSLQPVLTRACACLCRSLHMPLCTPAPSSSGPLAGASAHAAPTCAHAPRRPVAPLPTRFLFQRIVSCSLACVRAPPRDHAPTLPTPAARRQPRPAQVLTRPGVQRRHLLCSAALWRWAGGRVGCACGGPAVASGGRGAAPLRAAKLDRSLLYIAFLSPHVMRAALSTWQPHAPCVLPMQPSGRP